MKLSQRIFGITLASLLGMAPVAANPLQGDFALSTTRSEITSSLNVMYEKAPLTYTFDIVQTKLGSTRPIREYTKDYDKELHLVVISDDFKNFLHLHSKLDSSGHFRGTYRFPRASRYFVYVDSRPRGLDQQVFRFPVLIGSAVNALPLLAASSKVSKAGPYRVTLNRNMLAAGKENVVAVNISKNGRPADDLHGYLGGAAHAVFINAKMLTYTHVHPVIEAEQGSEHDHGMMSMNMGAMNRAKEIGDTDRVPAHYQLHIAAQTAGRYKLWLQFRGGKNLYVAPFVIDVR